MIIWMMVKFVVMGRKRRIEILWWQWQWWRGEENDEESDNGDDKKNKSGNDTNENTDNVHHPREGLLGGPVVEGAVESLSGGQPHPVVWPKLVPARPVICVTQAWKEKICTSQNNTFPF